MLVSLGSDVRWIQNPHIYQNRVLALMVTHADFRKYYNSKRTIIVSSKGKLLKESMKTRESNYLHLNLSTEAWAKITF